MTVLPVSQQTHKLQSPLLYATRHDTGHHQDVSTLFTMQPNSTFPTKCAPYLSSAYPFLSLVADYFQYHGCNYFPTATAMLRLVLRQSTSTTLAPMAPLIWTDFSALYRNTLDQDTHLSPTMCIFFLADQSGTLSRFTKKLNLA